MRNVLVLACGLALTQLFACSSSDNNSPGTNSSSGGSVASTTAEGGSGNDTTATEGGTESNSSSASGGKTSGTTNSSGGKTATSTSSSGGNTSSSGTSSSSSPDSALTPNSPYAGKLALNEICPSNKTAAMEGSSYPDWVELYNSSSEDISLKGFYITDDNAELTKFPLAKDTLVVKAGGVLILWADGDIDETDFHLGFSLSAGGETLTLLDPDQKVIDSVTWTNAEADKTYSRLPDGSGSFSWCAAGTPNLKNGAACK